MKLCYHHWRPPFMDRAFWNSKRPGRARSFAYLGKRPGIYLIRDGNVLVYVGVSGSDVIKAMYRHFYSWEPDRWFYTQRRVTYPTDSETHTTAIISTETQSQAWELEKTLIRMLGPRDNVVVDSLSGEPFEYSPENSVNLHDSSDNPFL